MKFLIDAQLPARLADHLRTRGHDAIHASSLPKGNRSSDSEIAQLADAALIAPVVCKRSSVRVDVADIEANARVYIEAARRYL